MAVARRELKPSPGRPPPRHCLAANDAGLVQAFVTRIGDLVRAGLLQSLAGELGQAEIQRADIRGRGPVAA